MLIGQLISLDYSDTIALILGNYLMAFPLPSSFPPAHPFHGTSSLPCSGHFNHSKFVTPSSLDCELLEYNLRAGSSYVLCLSEGDHYSEGS